jgi:hypothetical protein
MYIMAKRLEKLGLILADTAVKVSILESRNNIQAVALSNSGGLHPKSTPQRMDQCRKADQRGLRKSSSLTNGIGRARNKAPLKEYGIEARGLHLSCDIVNASILDTPVNGSL